MTPSIYLNLEDDVAKIVARIKREKSGTLVLVCPKRCFLFNDSINLRLLKKQADLLGKEVFILTMDERGQAFAKEAGFQLKFLPKSQRSGVFSDVRLPDKAAREAATAQAAPDSGPIATTVNEIKNMAKMLVHLPAREEENADFLEPVKTLKHPVHKTAAAPSPKVSVNDSIFPKEIEEAHKIKKNKAFNQKAITGLVAVSLIVILAVVLVVLPRATVAVYPKSEPVTRDLVVSMGAAVQKADAGRLIMPAEKIDQALQASGGFQSQGKKEVGNKAAGTVQIYNFTRSPINLKAGTTVLSVGNKSYSLAADIVQLKPTAYKNEKTKEVDESTLSAPVEITAAEGGASYNLPAGTRMEITNQVFGSKPQFLYAKSATAITGGTSRYLSLVSDQDLATAKTSLERQIVQNIQDELKQKGQAMPDKFYLIQDIEFSSDKPAGTESPSFNATLKAKVTGLAFKTDELGKLISDRISQTLSGDKTLKAKQPDLDYKLKSMDLNNNTAVVEVHYEGNAVYNVNISDIASGLVGKTNEQVREILSSNAAIERIDTTLAPVWQKNFPWFAGKIKVVNMQDSMEIR